MHRFFAEFICYDDTCHLRKFARNSVKTHLTPHTMQLASVEMVVDKMHMKGHTDTWCKENCDPAKFQALQTITSLLKQIIILLTISDIFAGRHRNLQASALLVL